MQFLGYFRSFGDSLGGTPESTLGDRFCPKTLFFEQFLTFFTQRYTFKCSFIVKYRFSPFKWRIKHIFCVSRTNSVYIWKSKFFENLAVFQNFSKKKILQNFLRFFSPKNFQKKIFRIFFLKKNFEFLFSQKMKNILMKLQV